MRILRRISTAKALGALLILSAGTAAAQGSGGGVHSLGVFERWGAFQDAGGGRCYAIARTSPHQQNGQMGATPYLSIGYWTKGNIRGQFYARTSRTLGRDGVATVVIGNQRFALRGANNSLWTANPRDDAAIVTAMRGGGTIIVTATGGQGAWRDTYPLKGAATALDAAALACAKS